MKLSDDATTLSTIHDARLLTYITQLAGHQWGTPGGFAGRTCFQVIPALELERRGGASGIFHREWIDCSLELLTRRRDCQDFAMVGFLWMLYRYPNSRLLTPALRTEIEAALLAAKYDEQDAGADSCCWHTENHQVQYASSELLMGQRFPDVVFANSARKGHWHYARAYAKLRRWLDWRQRFSFSEWNSSCYYDEDAAALLNLAAYAEDAELRGQARAVFDQLVYHVAVNSWRGLTGASQGRAYLAQQIAPAETPMATLAQVCWGEGPVPERLSLGTLLLAAGDVRVPPAVLDIGRDCSREMENRERHGLDAEEAATYGVLPDDLRDLPFFQAAGQASHHLVVEARYRYFDGQEKWPGFFADRDYYRRCKAVGSAFDPWSLPHALGHADFYTFRTPDYLLGCAQDYHPGAPGYQQFIWCATLGSRAVVFTTNPAPVDCPYGRPGPWVGNGVLPKVVQQRNVLIALHRVRPCPIYDQPPWFREDRVHAWFPRGAFDEVIEQAGWCFGRKDSGFIGLRPLKPAVWASPQVEFTRQLGSDEPYEWVVDDTDVAWICELGSTRSHGSFTTFIERLSVARIEGDIDHLCYDSPSLGLIEIGWQQDLRVAGHTIAIHDYPRFDNPFGRAEFGKPLLEIPHGRQ